MAKVRVPFDESYQRTGAPLQQMECAGKCQTVDSYLRVCVHCSNNTARGHENGEEFQLRLMMPMLWMRLLLLLLLVVKVIESIGFAR